MHIVQLLPELNQGGIERGVVELNRELVARGFRSTVVSAGGALVPTIEQDGGTHLTVDICSKNPVTAIARALKLRAALAEIAPSLLHVRSRVPGWLTALANRSLKLPLVSTVHGYNSVNCYSEIMTRGERVICVSHGIRDFVREHYGVDEARLRVVHRGVDLQAFANSANPEPLTSLQDTWSLNRPFVLAAGRISPLKGLDLMIEALSDPRLSGLDLVIAGSAGTRHGQHLQSLHDLIASRSLSDRVHFVGSQSDLVPWYAAAQAVVSTSRKPESFGRTHIEAMALETPVIAGRHGGALEIVRDGENGYLVTPGDRQELVEALAGIERLQTAGLRSYVQENFSLARMVSGILAVYEEVLPCTSC